MKRYLAFAFLGFLAATTPAAAYIGPGAGLGAIGTVFAVIGAILLMLVGFIWYPAKRLIKKLRKQPEVATEEE